MDKYEPAGITYKMAMFYVARRLRTLYNVQYYIQSCSWSWSHSKLSVVSLPPRFVATFHEAVAMLCQALGGILALFRAVSPLGSIDEGAGVLLAAAFTFTHMV